jgi:hypothetical protein
MKKFALGFFALIQKSLIIAPLLLIFFTVMSVFIKIVSNNWAMGPLDGSTLAVWKTFRNVLYPYYMISLFLLFLKFALFGEKESSKEDKAREINKILKPWLIGFLLTTFSYAIAGLIVDIGFLLFFLGGGAHLIGG